MRCQAARWAHSTDPRHEVEQAGYDLIGAMIKRWRLRAGHTQRELERLSGIDQTVISRLENGRQYGLRWSRFAILIAVLGGFDDGRTEPAPPWWVTMGITPPDYRLETLRQQGLLPPAPSPGDALANDLFDPDRDLDRA
jgi:transcriptional regulator with XRE-family HTH domain